MGNKELCETLKIIVCHHGDKPGVSTADLLTTLEELEKMGDNFPVCSLCCKDHPISEMCEDRK